MKKIILSTSLMLVFSIFVLTAQAQTAAQNPVKEKAKTEKSSETNADKAGCSHSKTADHKCTGDHKHNANHKCTGDHKTKDAKACADKTANKNCCSDKKADAKTSKTKSAKTKDGKETAKAKAACCSEKK
ncbi:MAG: hypothetical protein RBS19_10875 [Bacteroidales bacterium]|nr:hypothetical protein [Bacteroidales bacterium]